MKQKIKNLIFDVGGVIILTKKVDFSKFDKMFSLRAGTMEKIVRTCFSKKMTDKDFDEKSFFEENFSHLLSWTDYQKILERIYKTEKTNKPLLNWIKKKKKTYKMFLLTNNTAALKPLLKEKFKIDHLFNFVFNSAEIGLAKPDPKLFEYLLKKIKTSPRECLFIDDKPENIEVARKIGFLSILFENNKKFLTKMRELGL